MSNASLKEQLQAVASQLPKTVNTKPASSSSHKPQQPQRQVPPKASIPQKNAKPKPKWLDYVQYGVELLKAYFPECFKSGNQVKPLKIGIKQDLVKRLSTMNEIVVDDKACMVKSLSYYVNTLSYLKTVTKDVMRVDLDGQPAGAVTAEEEQYSQEKHKSKMNGKEQSKNPIQEQSELGG